MTFLLVLAAGAGCGSDADGPRVPVKVMTYNIYLGSDLSRLVGSPGTELEFAL